MKKIFKTIKSTFLCIKYPFLYPRNRFTDKHYNNWKIIEKMKKLYSEAYATGNKDTGYEPILINEWKAIRWHFLKFYHDNVLQWFHCLTSYTEWDNIEPGWRKAFGKILLKELYDAMIQDGGKKYVRSVRILQIKEKWGKLQIYLSSYGKKTSEVIQKYEDISWKTCINCGKPSVGYTTGWICPYCKDCYEEMNDGKDKYTLRNEWFKFFDDLDDSEL